MSYELSDFILTIKNQSFSEIINVSRTSYEEFVKLLKGLYLMKNRAYLISFYYSILVCYKYYNRV